MNQGISMVERVIVKNTTKEQRAVILAVADIVKFPVWSGFRDKHDVNRITHVGVHSDEDLVEYELGSVADLEKMRTVTFPEFITYLMTTYAGNPQAVEIRLNDCITGTIVAGETFVQTCNDEQIPFDAVAELHRVINDETLIAKAPSIIPNQYATEKVSVAVREAIFLLALSKGMTVYDQVRRHELVHQYPNIHLSVSNDKESIEVTANCANPGDSLHYTFVPLAEFIETIYKWEPVKVKVKLNENYTANQFDYKVKTFRVGCQEFTFAAAEELYAATQNPPKQV
jgi:hypothetical protein